MATVKSIENEEKQLTPEELKALVLGAQQDDEEAKIMLYERFGGLIGIITTEGFFKAKLKEDVKSEAWLIFWDIIMNYHGDNWETLPGYLDVCIRGRLTNLIKREISAPASVYIDKEDEDGNGYQIADTKEQIRSLDFEKSIDTVLNQLSPQQKLVIVQLVLNDMSLDEFYESTGISKEAACVQRKRALDKIRKVLYNF